MGTALAFTTRQRIIEGYENGASCRALAQEFNVAYHTVRVLCRRFDEQGIDALLPRYKNCGTPGIRNDALLYRAACYLKRLHPSWGAPFIHLQLELRYGHQRTLPGVRTMQRWFKARGLVPPRSKPPKPKKQWAQAVHHVWQVDAKEHQQTADGVHACYLTITDEHSTAIMAAPVFPPQANLASTSENGSIGAD